jgi:hypothetical protein
VDAPTGADGAVIVDVATTPDAAPVGTCSVASDCAWGEIDHEIRTRADCPCTFGCPDLALDRATVARRQAQYAALCTPGVDGQGHGCPVDDCALPGSISCHGGVCAAP